MCGVMHELVCLFCAGVVFRCAVCCLCIVRVFLVGVLCVCCRLCVFGLPVGRLDVDLFCAVIRVEVVVSCLG